jgi:hypothetical protein
MFSITRTVTIGAVAAAAVFAVPTIAEARPLESDQRIGAKFVTSVCDGGDTIYRVRLRNDTGRRRSFYHDAHGQGVISNYNKGWTDIAGRTTLVDRYRVSPGETWSIEVRYERQDGYLLSWNHQATDTCAGNQSPLPPIVGLSELRDQR